MTSHQHQDDAHDEIAKARALIDANRVLIHEIETDRRREDVEALKARALLRRAKRTIKRASIAAV